MRPVASSASGIRAGNRAMRNQTASSNGCKARFSKNTDGWRSAAATNQSRDPATDPRRLHALLQHRAPAPRHSLRGRRSGASRRHDLIHTLGRKKCQHRSTAAGEAPEAAALTAPKPSATAGTRRRRRAGIDHERRRPRAGPRGLGLARNAALVCSSAAAAAYTPAERSRSAARPPR
jgi:hypothetical protein